MNKIYSQIEFSIVVLNWNGVSFLKNCYDSILTQTPRVYEIILADNNSSDNSIDFTKKNYPTVKILKLRENLGYTGANNAAARIAKGRYLIFLNNDVKLDTNYIRELGAFLEINPKAKIVATKEYSYNGKYFVSHSDGVDFLGYGCTYKEGKVHIAPGCAFIIERELFLKLKGFDEKMFIFHEEIDLCWRAYLMGVEPQIADKCRFFHFTGGGIPTWSVRRRYLGEKNNIRSILKNYSYPTLAFILPLYVSINFCEIIYLLFKGQIRTIKEAYFRAWVENIKDFGEIHQQHKTIQKNRVISDFQFLKKSRLCVGKWQGFVKIGKKVDFEAGL
jgi:GT2 family glycosyltransferase